MNLLLIALVLSAPPVTLPNDLTLEDAAQLAARRGLPLVVWVGGQHHGVGVTLPPAVHVRVATWKGDKTPGLVVAPLYQGWPHARRLIPAAQADLATVLAEMAGDWLRVPVRPTPLYFAPSAGRQC